MSMVANNFFVLPCSNTSISPASLPIYTLPSTQYGELQVS